MLAVRTIGNDSDRITARDGGGGGGGGGRCVSERVCPRREGKKACCPRNRRRINKYRGQNIFFGLGCGTALTFPLISNVVGCEKKAQVKWKCAPRCQTFAFLHIRLQHAKVKRLHNSTLLFESVPYRHGHRLSGAEGEAALSSFFLLLLYLLSYLCAGFHSCSENAFSQSSL